MNYIYQSKLFKQLNAVIGLLIILAIGIPGAFTLFYITPNVVEERYHNVMTNDVDFLAARLDWLLVKSLADVKYLSTKISVSDPAKLQEAGKLMDIFVRSSDVFTGGIATDQKGIMQLFYSSPQGLIELTQKNNISTRDYIKYPLANNQTYLSDVTITNTNPSPVIFVSSAIVERDQTSGVLALSINLWNENNIFRAVFNGFQEKKQGTIYVIDGQGRIVFHMDRELVGLLANPSISSQFADTREGLLDNISSEHGKVDLAFRKLTSNNWIVVYEMGHDEIYSMSIIGRYIYAGTLVLVLLLGLLASAVFVRIILRPLEQITNATEQVAAGDLTQRIDYNGHDDLRGVMKNFNSMTTNLKFQYDELEKLSLHDYLTGLANRRYFEQQLHLELERATRLGHPSTLLMLDIDDFKHINDKYGHLKGDKILKILASALKEIVREVDLPVRFGGEEFLVLLPETSLAQGQIVAEKIRKEISQITIVSRKGNITITVSIGMSGTEHDDKLCYALLDRAGAGLLKRADEALYQAKAKGKNRVQVWESSD